MARPQKYPVKLSSEERKKVKSMIDDKKTSKTVRDRLMILLTIDTSTGLHVSYTACAKTLSVQRDVVSRVAKLYHEGGLSGLQIKRNRHSDTANRKVNAWSEALIMTTSWSNPPKGYAGWTLTLIKDRLKDSFGIELSRSTISNVLKTEKIKPHLKWYWKIPPKEDAEFAARMDRILWLYSLPYDPTRPLVCVDEKSLQLLKDSRLIIKASANHPEIHDAEYVRNGTAAIFAMIEPHTGRITTKAHRRRTKVEFAHFLKHIADDVYPKAEEIVLVMDNLNTHKLSTLYEVFDKDEALRLNRKFRIEHTPVHGSWLDIAEVAINILTTECLGKRRIGTLDELIDELNAWEEDRNREERRIKWRFTTDDAHQKLEHLYPRVPDGGVEINDVEEPKKQGEAEEKNTSAVSSVVDRGDASTQVSAASQAPAQSMNKSVSEASDDRAKESEKLMLRILKSAITDGVDGGGPNYLENLLKLLTDMSDNPSALKAIADKVESDYVP